MSSELKQILNSALSLQIDHERNDNTYIKEKEFRVASKENLGTLESLFTDKDIDDFKAFYIYIILLEDIDFYPILEKEFDRLFNQLEVSNKEKHFMDNLVAFAETEEETHLFMHIKKTLESGMLSKKVNVRRFCAYLAGDFLIEKNYSLFRAVLKAQSEDSDLLVRGNAFVSLHFYKVDINEIYVLPSQRTLDKILLFFYSKKLHLRLQ